MKADANKGDSSDNNKMLVRAMIFFLFLFLFGNLFYKIYFRIYDKQTFENKSFSHPLTCLLVRSLRRVVFFQVRKLTAMEDI
jgi:hypothetical protein